MQNTHEALEHALNFWGESSNCVELDQSKRFLAMLALNQKMLEIVLDVLPENSDYTVDMNIKLLLMTETGDWNGICDLLYKIKTNRLKSLRYRVFAPVVSGLTDIQIIHISL